MPPPPAEGGMSFAGEKFPDYYGPEENSRGKPPGMFQGTQEKFSEAGTSMKGEDTLCRGQ
eukprot:gene199-17788_t